MQKNDMKLMTVYEKVISNGMFNLTIDLWRQKDGAESHTTD